MSIKGIYVITSEDFVPGRTHEQVAEAAIEGGATAIQIRDKTSDDRRFLEAALVIRRLTREAGVLFIVNNRIDIAVASEADGVHLGQSDLPIKYAKKILGPGKIVGISADNLDEAIQAQEDGADHIGYGPIYQTSTKLDTGPVTGLEKMKAIQKGLSIPVVAIGGINESNVAQVAAAGADSVAVVSVVAAAPDMVEATRRLVELFNENI